MHYDDRHDDLRSEGHGSPRYANPSVTDHDDHHENPGDHPNAARASQTNGNRSVTDHDDRRGSHSVRRNEGRGSPRNAHRNAMDHDDHHASPNASFPNRPHGSRRACPPTNDPWRSACRHPSASPRDCRREGDRSPQAFRNARATTAFPRCRATAHPDDHCSTDVRRMAYALILRVNCLLLASPFPSMCPRVGALSPQTTKATRRWPLLKNCPAASYSPTQSPVQYHRR